MRARVTQARRVQIERYAALGLTRIRTNAECDGAMLEEIAAPDRAGLTLLREAADALSLTRAVITARLGSPAPLLLTDRAGIRAGAAQLLSQRGQRSNSFRRAVVLIDPVDRGDIPSFRADGFGYYLVRPVRPVSLLTQLFADRPDVSVPTSVEVQPVSPIPAEGKAASILLAEDNNINALLACTVLEKSGARVVRVRNGADAVAKARNALNQSDGKGFDLVLMDIHMPDMDGVEAARRIKALYPEDARPSEGRPPIVALTANAFAEDRAHYLEAGLDDYLAKPFDKADFAALFARWCRPGTEREGQAGFGAA